MLMDKRADFYLPTGHYFLNHSVGRPLKQAKAAVETQFFSPWQYGDREPWQDWLGVIQQFTQALGRLFNHDASTFCPQVNLSSALCKILMSISRLKKTNCVILMSEQDFPSMGFAIKQALPHAKIRFIAKHLDITHIDTWQHAITSDIDLVFISHVYSNSGQASPVKEIVGFAKQQGCLTLIDVAQSAGILPIDLTAVNPDFMIGSSVKWLCSGPGAAYLWVNPWQLETCQPKDVGWFSHENPFEFNIHDFRYHASALRFWGGTPSIMPYALAASSIEYFTSLGIDKVRAHNVRLANEIIEKLKGYVASPIEESRRSGTVIINAGDKSHALLEKLTQHKMSVDLRQFVDTNNNKVNGLRISPHIYNTMDDVEALCQVVLD